MTKIGKKKGCELMNYETERLIQELTELILDGVSEKYLLEQGYPPEAVEAAIINYLALYF